MTGGGTRCGDVEGAWNDVWGGDGGGGERGRWK